IPSRSLHADEAERSPERGRLYPAVLLPRVDVAARRAAEDVEAERFLADVDDPVFRYVRVEVRLAELDVVLVLRTLAEDVGDHVGRPLQLHETALLALEQPDPVRPEGRRRDEHPIRVTGDVRREVAE